MTSNGMKTLICGNGWIGKILKDFLDADISQERIQNIKPATVKKYDVVINCAGKTNIDWCEKNKSEALAVNAIYAGELARVCKKLGKKYVYLSSACIFESMSANDWKDEYSAPNPGCFYSLTKVIGEHLVREACPEALVIRIRLPISKNPHPRNTLTKILGYQILHTNQETVTVVEDMLPVLKKLIQKGEKGIFHLVNKDTISPFQMRASLGKGDFKAITKKKLDEAILRAGRAKRVSTLVRSTRIPALPSIRSRMPEIARAYKENL